MKSNKPEKVAVIADIHSTEVDLEVIEKFFLAMDDYKPNRLVIAGDLFDCYKLSFFDKSPDRREMLQEEIDFVYDLLSPFFKRHPKMIKDFVMGNHENRLLRQQVKNPGFFGLRSLEPEHLFRINELGMNYHPKLLRHKGFVFTHGSKVAIDGSSVAKKEHNKYGCSGISGHLHRNGVYYRRTIDNLYSWHTIGCMCHLEPEYIDGLADWNNGFAVVEFMNDNRFNVTPVVYTCDKKFTFNGKVY